MEVSTATATGLCQVAQSSISDDADICPLFLVPGDLPAGFGKSKTLRVCGALAEANDCMTDGDEEDRSDRDAATDIDENAPLSSHDEASDNEAARLASLTCNSKPKHTHRSSETRHSIRSGCTSGASSSSSRIGGGRASSSSSTGDTTRARSWRRLRAQEKRRNRAFHPFRNTPTSSHPKSNPKSHSHSNSSPKRWSSPARPRNRGVAGASGGASAGPSPAARSSGVTRPVTRAVADPGVGEVQVFMSLWSV